jgi:hypothetical protein
VVVLKPSVLLAWTAKSLVNVLLISREQRAKREAGPAGLRETVEVSRRPAAWRGLRKSTEGQQVPAAPPG